tara:strand:- start:259 stop:663 length:405 start_codon:yes stop_codon:yes gene_type:complete
MFFDDKDEKENFNKIAALLIHAARIDQDFSTEEEKIIEKTLSQIGVKKENIKEVVKEGKKIESDSNQILEFTKQVKKMKESDKHEIIKSLWKIIYSNNEADVYETGLMRRLAGLLYIDSKTMGDIKEAIKNKKI